ncbi:MAG TPA: DUF2218 domain-containing protein [Alcanivorax sp.]|nr:DUF2218 domain-containing protein [Alcanivorax sp.]
MEHAHGFAATGQASLYLKKLCRHFSHKLETQFDDHNGVIRFPFGTCELSADEQALHLHCQAGSNDLERLREIIDSHLARFTTREPLTLRWH